MKRPIAFTLVLASVLLAIGCKPAPKRLTAKEAADALALLIGKWEGKGQRKYKDSGWVPVSVESKQVIHWKEKGKSIEGTFQIVVDGKEEPALAFEKTYDPASGLFILRGGMAGSGLKLIQHRRYDPATRTFQAISFFPERPEGLEMKFKFSVTESGRISSIFEIYRDGKLWGEHKTESLRLTAEEAAEVIEDSSILTLKGHEDTVDSVAWSSDGLKLASGSYDYNVRVWEADSGSELHILKHYDDDLNAPLTIDNYPFLTFAWSPDGTRIASGGQDRALKVWDASILTLGKELDPLVANSGKELHNITKFSSNLSFPRRQEAHQGMVLAVSWSPDSKKVASGGTRGTVRIWDNLSGKLLRLLRIGKPPGFGELQAVTAVAWSPDGSRIASGGVKGESGGSSGVVWIWDVKSGEELYMLSGHKKAVSLGGVAWGSDGGKLLSYSPDKTVRLWDTATGKELYVLKGHLDMIYSASWSPGGTKIVSCSEDKTAKVWDAESGKEIHTLKGHQAAVYDIAWSPDGTLLASCSGDKTVRVWDAKSGKEIHTLKGHQGAVYDVAWSPDGSRIASGGYEGIIKIWSIPK